MKVQTSHLFKMRAPRWETQQGFTCCPISGRLTALLAMLRIDGQVRLGSHAYAFVQGVLDAIRKTDLYNSPWEV